MIDRAQIDAALDRVFDPCSVRASAPLSVVDMGLITRISVEAGDIVRIGVRPTSPWCTMIGCIMQAMEEQVAGVEGVRQAIVEIDNSSMWTEADITEKGRQLLEDVRARSRAIVPMRRQQWRERAAASKEV